MEYSGGFILFQAFPKDGMLTPVQHCLRHSVYGFRVSYGFKNGGQGEMCNHVGAFASKGSHGLEYYVSFNLQFRRCHAMCFSFTLFLLFPFSLTPVEPLDENDGKEIYMPS